MAYSGYLIKVGNYTIDASKFISTKNYQVTRNIQDLDSYRDANGYLHRNSLEHVPIKVEFQTPAMLTNTEMSQLMNAIKNEFTNANERRALVSAYVPELDDYISQDMYMADPQFKIYGTYGNKVTYDAVRIAFIGY